MEEHYRPARPGSSTPIANLVLEELARTYDLPRILPLSKYGRWQTAYPQLACGLKRGFTFVRHEAGRHFEPQPDHANELLVAANPRHEIADTHWFREHFDHFIVEEVRAAGIPYYDQAEVVSLEHHNGWSVRANRLGRELHVSSPFLIDATGPSGLLPRVLDIETSPATVRTNSWSVFSHFVEVGKWQDVFLEQGGRIDRLIHGSYRAFGRFELLAAFTMYYFAGAIHSEERRRQGLAGERDEFLFSHHPPFRVAFVRGYERLLEIARDGSSVSGSEYAVQVARDIMPYNTAGLCDAAKNNMYPFA